MKKAPVARSLMLWNLSLTGRELLLFLRSSFLFWSGFLGCVLHRCDSPLLKICDLKNRNVIHI